MTASTASSAAPRAEGTAPSGPKTSPGRTAAGAARLHPGPRTRVKLRPGAHLAPVARGVHISHTRRSFVLGGPPALFALLDRHLGPLSDGTCLDDLVAADASEQARPVLAHVLRTLLDQGVLLDLDALDTPEPDPGTAERYADVLAFLEDHSDDPYGVFAALRSATVEVRGSGPAVPALLRGLAAHGVERVRVLPDVPASEEAEAPGAGEPATGEQRPGGSQTGESGAGRAPDVAVLVADADQPGGPDETEVWRAASTAGHPCVVVVARADLAAVATPGPRGPAADPEAALERAASWAALEPDGRTPRPMSAVLAGALAARACVEVLTGIGTDPADGSGTGPSGPAADQVSGHAPDAPPAADTAPHLTLVWGHALESRRIPLTGPDGDGPAGPEKDEAITSPDTASQAASDTVASAGGPDASATAPRAARSTAVGRVPSGPPGGKPDTTGRQPAHEAHEAPEAFGAAVPGRWQRVDVAALLADLADGRAPTPDPTGAYAASTPLTARWTGPARFERDLDVEQVPVSVASVRWVDSERTTWGWGPSRAVAGVQALLAGLRTARGGAEAEAPGGPVACAGVTTHQWLLDGLLRLTPVPHPHAPGARAVDWDSVTHHEVRALWGTLLDHFEQPVRLDLRPVEPLGWWVATAVRDTDGAVLGRQWGPGRESAVHAALVESCARVQSGRTRPDGRDGPPGTWVLHSLAPLRAAALARSGAALPGVLIAHRLVDDGVLPELPLPCGLLERR
ncbi:hypothetical protein JS756_28715 [Streptomyces actuosus]|uniref:YcaO domain-containing protein n=1 Tax=Streptomyces actuosus TaxID=1885 RepID=A0ABS2VYA6_STRAS|nr:hypothetical protein [Streptomyces actuosus]MBN0048023.1 hypothetical protein [Streptomyces actuosus]